MPSSTPELPNSCLCVSIVISVADNVKLVSKNIRGEFTTLTSFSVLKIFAYSEVSLSNNNMA